MVSSTLFTVFSKGRILTRETTEDYRYAWGIWNHDLQVFYDHGFVRTEKDAQTRGRAAMRCLRNERDLLLKRAPNAPLADDEAYGNVELFGAQVLGETAFWAALNEHGNDGIAEALAITFMRSPHVRGYTYFAKSGIKYDVTHPSQKFAWAIYSEARGCAVEWGTATDLELARGYAEKAFYHWRRKRDGMSRELLARGSQPEDDYGKLDIEITEFITEEAFRSLATEHTREQVKELLAVEERLWKSTMIPSISRKLESQTDE